VAGKSAGKARLHQGWVDRSRHSGKKHEDQVFSFLPDSLDFFVPFFINKKGNKDFDQDQFNLPR